MLASQAGVCSRLLPKPLATAAAMRNRLQAGARGSCLQLPARCSTVRSSAAGPPRRRLSTTIAHRLLATPQSGIRVVMKAASEMDGVRMHCTARLACHGHSGCCALACTGTHPVHCHCWHHWHSAPMADFDACIL